MKHIRFLFLLLVIVGCSENSLESYVLEIQEEPYTHRYWAFREIMPPIEHVGRPTRLSVNGKFTNISKVEYEAYPVAYVAFGKINSERRIYVSSWPGNLGYTETEDWGPGSTHEERFQPLSLVRTSIRPKETLRIKVLTPWFVPSDTIFVTLVYVINGVQDIPRDQVTW